MHRFENIDWYLLTFFFTNFKSLLKFVIYHFSGIELLQNFGFGYF